MSRERLTPGELQNENLPPPSWLPAEQPSPLLPRMRREDIDFFAIPGNIRPVSVIERLNQMDTIDGPVTDSADGLGPTSADQLYYRVLGLGSEESDTWDEASRETLWNVRWGFAALAYDRLSIEAQVGVVYSYQRWSSAGRFPTAEITLAPDQAGVLADVAGRVGIAFDPHNQTVSLASIPNEHPWLS